MNQTDFFCRVCGHDIVDLQERTWRDGSPMHVLCQADRVAAKEAAARELLLDIMEGDDIVRE